MTSTRPPTIRQAPLTRLKRDLRVPWVVLALVLATVGGFVAATQYREHRRIELRERERLATQARVVEENLIHQLGGIRRALEGIRRELPHWLEEGHAEQASLELTTACDAMPAIRTFLITDRTGTVLAANRKELIGRDFSFRDYFAIPRTAPDSGKLYISPRYTTTFHVTAINIGRTITGPDGRFGGVVSGTLSPEFLRILFGSVLYAPGVSIALASGNSPPFLELAMKQDNRVEQPSASAVPSVHPQRNRGNEVFMATEGGRDYLVAQRAIQPGELQMDRPLVVSIARDMSGTLYEGWRRETSTIAGLYGLFAFLLTGGLYRFQRHQSASHQLMAGYEYELQQRDERLKLATRATGVGIWDWNLASGTLTCDATMSRMYGRGLTSCEEWRDAVVPDDRAESALALQRAIDQQEPLDATFGIVRGDGQVRWIRGRAIVQYDRQGRATRVIGSNVDITEQLQEAQDLQRAKENATAANAAISRFMATIAHEFRTPLSLLTSSADILDRYSERLSQAQRTQQLDHVRQATRQLAGLVESVLAFNRCGTPALQQERSQVELPRFCRSVALQIETVCCTGHRFEVDIAEESGTVLIDELLLRRVLENLLTNAFRCTPPGGTISFSVRRQCELLVMTVADTGIGIPDEERERIFEPFYRCHNNENSRGLGLGLAIVQEALALLEGTLTVSSSIGQGTTIRVEVPLTAPPAPEEEQPCIRF